MHFETFLTKFPHQSLKVGAELVLFVRISMSAAVIRRFSFKISATFEVVIVSMDPLYRPVWEAKQSFSFPDWSGRLKTF